MKFNGKFIIYCTNCGSSECDVFINYDEEWGIVCDECENEFNQSEKIEPQVEED